jgi:hypothetical protein
MAGELHRGEGLRDIADAGAARGSFSFDPDELRSLITKWRELADDYADSRRAAEAMMLVTPPAEDFASEAHAKAANRSGASYSAYLLSNWMYCRDQADLFQQALDDYLGVEHVNESEVNKSGREV